MKKEQYFCDWCTKEIDKTKSCYEIALAFKENWRDRRDGVDLTQLGTHIYHHVCGTCTNAFLEKLNK